ncbi:MAG: hypothetical protein ACI4EA_09185 [Candidatus Ornithomonoglobus sp.]
MPYINTVSGYDPSTSSIYTFKGINKLRRGYSGEFEDMVNMSTLEYPCAAPRGSRAEAAKAPGSIQAAAAPDVQYTDTISGFTGIAGGGFYYDGVLKSGSAALSDSMTWQIARMRNLYVLNGYDAENRTHAMYYYNVDTDEFDYMHDSMTDLIVTTGKDDTGNYISLYTYEYSAVYNHSVTLADGTVIKNSDFFNKYYSGLALPSVNVFEKRYKVDGNGENVLDEDGLKIPASTSDYKEKFTVGDRIIISGFPSADISVGQVWYYNKSEEKVYPQTGYDIHYNNVVNTDLLRTMSGLDKYQIVIAIVDGFSTEKISVAVSGTTCYRHKMYVRLYNKNGDEVDFDTLVQSASGERDIYVSGISISKLYHSFDNIAIHNNRVWGTLPNGEEIYASTADDVFDYSTVSETYGTPLYVRLASDRPGVFTGLCEYNTDLLAFKESSFVVIIGDDAGNYTQSVTSGIGCIDPRSIAVTPSGVIFLSYNGFYLYNGSRSPALLSSKLNNKFVSAVAGFDGNIYYAFAQDRSGNKMLLTYDLRYSLWHIQDSIFAVAPAPAELTDEEKKLEELFRDKLLSEGSSIVVDLSSTLDVCGMFMFKGDFYIADKCSNKILLCNSESDEEVNWSFTSVRSYTNALDNKSLTELWIRAEVSDGAWFKVETAADNKDFVVHTYLGNPPGEHVYRIPVRFDPGTTYRYRISGVGKVVFYEIEAHIKNDGRKYKDTDPQTSKTKLDKVNKMY